jgi:hypothetical protein
VVRVDMSGKSSQSKKKKAGEEKKAGGSQEMRGNGEKGGVRGKGRKEREDSKEGEKEVTELFSETAKSHHEGHKERGEEGGEGELSKTHYDPHKEYESEKEEVIVVGEKDGEGESMVDSEGIRKRKNQEGEGGTVRKKPRNEVERLRLSMRDFIREKKKMSASEEKGMEVEKEVEKEGRKESEEKMETEEEKKEEDEKMKEEDFEEKREPTELEKRIGLKVKKAAGEVVFTPSGVKENPPENDFRPEKPEMSVGGLKDTLVEPLKVQQVVVFHPRQYHQSDVSYFIFQLSFFH